MKVATETVSAKYTIGFTHTSTKEASSKREALRIVRIEARSQIRFGRVPRLRHVEGCDGEYIYLGTEAMHQDCDGSRAFAVISPQA